MKTIQQFICLLLLGTASTNAQVNIGSTATPHASSILELTSTNKGLLPPRMTEAQRNAIASPVAGLTIYNTTEKCLNFHNGTGWKSYCNENLYSVTQPIKYRLGGSGADYAESIQQTADGGYILVGYTSSSANGDVTGIAKGGGEVWVVKLNADGSIDWEKNYGGNEIDYAYSIQQTTDGGYILAGSTLSSANGDVTGTSKGGQDIWVVKLKADGSIDWQKNYGGSGHDIAHSIQQTTDGGYILAGETGSSANGDVTGIAKGDGDVWVVKLNADGTIDWQKNYGGSGQDRAYSIQQTTDGGYILAGYTASSASGDVGTSKGAIDFWVVKLNASGNITWQKNYGGSGQDRAYSIQQTTDGGYILAGYTDSSASGDVTGTSKGGSDVWVVKLNASGNITWQKNYGGSSADEAKSIQQTTDGGYILAGHTNSSASGDVTGTSKGVRDVWVVKLNASGSITWQKNYGGSGSDSANSIQQTTDGKYVVAGYSAHASAGTGDQANLTSRGGQDIWVFTIDENGTILP